MIPDYPLAAYCSQGSSYESFLTTRFTVDADIRLLLNAFGTSTEVRERVIALLDGQRFDLGFRFESSEQTTDPDRTVVFVAIPNPYIDAKKEPLKGRVPSAAAGAWRKTA